MRTIAEKRKERKHLTWQLHSHPPREKEEVKIRVEEERGGEDQAAVAI